MAPQRQHRQPFEYTPLDVGKRDIRLLELLPHSHRQGALSGNITTVALTSSPSFQCLSYVWGQSSGPGEPLVIGEREISITASLEGALRGLRQAESPLRIWCDQICINQLDGEERRQQVSLMRNIFSMASLVDIWLGPEFPGAEDAFLTLMELAEGRSLRTIMSARSNKARGIENLATIFNFTWWDRLWIIQEVLLARKALVHCGSCVVDFETIMQAFELFWNEAVQHGAELYRVCGVEVTQSLVRKLEITIRRLHVTRSLCTIRTSGEGRRLRDDPAKWPFVMHNCAWSSATDARDKVYGTLGLFPNLHLEADYSLPLDETYCNSTFAMIKRLGTLSILTQAISNVSVASGLPSWVPDWRAPNQSTGSLLVFYNYFQAGRGLVLDAELINSRSLSLSAKFIDEVDEVGLALEPTDIDNMAKLIPYLTPVIQDWLRVASVRGPAPFSLYQLRFTRARANPYAPDTRADGAMATTGGRPDQTGAQQPLNFGDTAYAPAQSRHAPMSSFGGRPAQAGIQDYRRSSELAQQHAQSIQDKRRQIDVAYQPAQSTSAPIYKDAHPKTVSWTNKDAPSHNSERHYDHFSHTYVNADSLRTSSSSTTNSAKAREANDEGPIYVDGSTPSSEVFWRTLCMDIVEDSELKSHRRCRSGDSVRVWQWVDVVCLAGQSFSWDDRCPILIPQMHWHFMTHLQGKRMFKTKRGYVGLASQHTAVGDHVYVLASGAYPYVVRPVEGSSDPHELRLVSPAYVHGVMDGVDDSIPSVRVRIS